jgi:hypothetical protein
VGTAALADHPGADFQHIGRSDDVPVPGSTASVTLANSWIIINVGGGPTGDKPAVTLETPRDPDLASSFLNIRVSDIHAVYGGVEREAPSSTVWLPRGGDARRPVIG